MSFLSIQTQGNLVKHFVLRFGCIYGIKMPAGKEEEIGYTESSR